MGLKPTSRDLLVSTRLCVERGTWPDSTSARRGGTCWAGGTTWHGRTAMRISVSGWATTGEDVDRSVAAIVRVARAVSA